MNHGFITPKMLALLTALSSVMAYGFTTFATKDEVKTIKEDIVSRLMRIEDKVDNLLLEKSHD